MFGGVFFTNSVFEVCVFTQLLQIKITFFEMHSITKFFSKALNNLQGTAKVPVCIKVNRVEF